MQRTWSPKSKEKEKKHERHGKYNVRPGAQKWKKKRTIKEMENTTCDLEPKKQRKRKET